MFSGGGGGGGGRQRKGASETNGLKTNGLKMKANFYPKATLHLHVTLRLVLSIHQRKMIKAMSRKINPLSASVALI